MAAVRVTAGALLAAALVALVPEIGRAQAAHPDTTAGDTARQIVRRPAPSPPAGPCDPWMAFGLGVVVPGGGQFYLRDWAGGIQAIASDALLYVALDRSGSTLGGIALFIGTKHVIEGLFAAQECRTRSRRPAPRPADETAMIAAPFPRARDHAWEAGIDRRPEDRPAMLMSVTLPLRP